MPGSPTVTTLWTAAWRNSNVDRTCPGVHVLPDRPDVHYVITRRIAPNASDAYLAEHAIELQPGQVVGAVPVQMSPAGHLVSTLVTDPGDLAAFADLMAPDEQLGTVPAADRPAILLTEAELNDLIDDHHRAEGDVLFHREGLPWYDVPSQNADREAWLAGRLDPTAINAWTVRLADERRRGMTSRRLRILSERFTDDERAAVCGALPIIADQEQVRVLHRGEHPVPGVVDHDYWIAHPAGGDPVVIRSHYTDGGAFVGAEVVPPQRHDRYLHDAQLGWTAAVPFADWMAAHPELARDAVA